MMVFKRRQIVVLSFILVVIIAGYLQYSYKRSSTAIAGREGSRLGEAVYVDNRGAGPVESKTGKATTTPVKTPASKQANDFFSQTKLEREINRSKDMDTLKEITSDANASKDVKTRAYEKVMKMVDISEKETRIEALIKEKGFSDAVALFGDDGSLDIVIKADNLTSAQTAQIADMVSRQANIPVSSIHIRNIY